MEQGRPSAGDADDRPALVLLPGPTDGWRSYGPVLEHLAMQPPDIRTVAVSLRGHGSSDKPAEGYEIDDLAGDVVGLLDALDIPSAVLVGHSGSCLVARRVALDHPARVAGLVLEASPATLVGDPSLASFLAEVVAGLTDPIDVTFARAFVTDTSSPELSPDLVDALVEDVVAVPARVWRALFGALARTDDRLELGRLAVPTHLVWGDGDPLVGRAAQEELLELLPAAELTVYAGAGHTPRWEQPARFAADLRRATHAT